MYVALSRVTSIEGLFLIGTYKDSAIVVDQRVIAEYERLRNYCLFEFNKHFTSDEEFSIALCNVRLLKKHLPDIKADKRFIGCDLILCTEKQISKNETADIRLSGFNVLENNAEHKYSSMAMYAKEGIEIEEIFRLDGILLVQVLGIKYSLKVLWCYRKSDWAIREFSELVHYLSISHEPDFILGDFNMKPTEQFLEHYQQQVRDATHIAGSILDHVYLGAKLQNINSYTNVNSVFFSDHEMIRVSISA